MKAVLSAICLLTLTGCLAAPRVEYVEPVIITVDRGYERTTCVGIPWGDYVIMPGHTGSKVVESPEATTIFVNGDALSVAGRPVCSDREDWCLVRPSKPVASADIELFQDPGADLWIVKIPLDGGAPKLVACWPASWHGEPDEAGDPSRSEIPWENIPAPPGLLCMLLVAEPMEPGTSGSPMLYWDKQRRQYRVCGMVVGSSPEWPTVAVAVPFWGSVGAELLEKRQKAESDAADPAEPVSPGARR